MTPEQEAKLTLFIETAQAQNDKMDGLIGSVNQLVPQVRDAKSDIRFLRSEIVEIKETDATQSQQIKNSEGDINALGKKVREHVGSSKLHRSSSDAFADANLRWTFIAKVAVGLGAVIGLLVTLAKFIPHH